MNALRKFGWVALLASLLMGCASAPRTVQDDAAIKSVAVVAMLPSGVRIKRLGLTVFNNDERFLPGGAAMNRMSTDVIAARLRQVRPDWSVKTAEFDPEALAMKFRGSGWSPFDWDRVRADVAAVADKAGVDALIVLTEWRDQHGDYGVGLTMRALPGFTPTAWRHNRALLMVTDRRGNELVRRGLGPLGAPVDPLTLGLTGDLTSLVNPGVADKVLAAIEDELRRSLGDALTSMGY